MKTHTTWVILVVTILVLAGVVTVYELRLKDASRTLTSETASELESYFQAPGIYRSVGPIPEPVKATNNFSWSLGENQRSLDYMYVVGMKPAIGKSVAFDIFVIKSKVKDTYPPLLEISNVLNLSAWDVQTLKLSFSVNTTRYFDQNTETQGMPGITHEIIAGQGVTLGSNWAAVRSQMTGWEEGIVLLNGLDKVKAGESQLYMQIALMGDEAYLFFVIQPKRETQTNDSSNSLRALGDDIVNSFKDIGQQIKDSWKGDLNAYSYYMVSTAALTGFPDCTNVNADESSERTFVSGKPACALDTRRNTRRNALDEEVSKISGMTQSMRSFIFEDLGI